METMNCFEKLTELKIEIKKKYSSLKHFAYCNGLELSDVNRFIQGRMKDGFDRYHERIMELLDVPARPNPDEITPEQRQQLTLDIIKNYGSYLNFSKMYPEFSPSFITHVCGGKKKRMNEKVRLMIYRSQNRPE